LRQRRAGMNDDQIAQRDKPLDASRGEAPSNYKFSCKMESVLY